MLQGYTLVRGIQDALYLKVIRWVANTCLKMTLPQQFPLINYLNKVIRLFISYVGGGPHPRIRGDDIFFSHVNRHICHQNNDVILCAMFHG